MIYKSVQIKWYNCWRELSLLKYIWGWNFSVLRISRNIALVVISSLPVQFQLHFTVFTHIVIFYSFFVSFGSLFALAYLLDIDFTSSLLCFLDILFFMLFPTFSSFWSSYACSVYSHVFAHCSCLLSVIKICLLILTVYSLAVMIFIFAFLVTYLWICF